jgi:hypothetical protein
MTDVDVKTCGQPTCAAVFHRNPGQSRSRFQAQKFCSQQCARSSRVRREHDDVKVCESPGCGRAFHRPAVKARDEFARRRFCSPQCAHNNRDRPANPIMPTLAPATGEWRRHAACVGEGIDPLWFDPVSVWDSAAEALATRTANTFCARCPALLECGADADANRDLGMRAGVYRLVRQGRYWWQRFIPDAPEPQLPDRRRSTP